MKYGYDVVTEAQKYQGSFSAEDQVSQSTSDENECTTIYEKTLGGDLRVRLVITEDLRAHVSQSRLVVMNPSERNQIIKKAHIGFWLPIPFATLHYFTSDWGSEFSPVKLDITYPITIGTYAGRASKGCDPFFVTGWEKQGYFGVAIGYSGNWSASFRRLPEENYVAVGLLEEAFETEIPPNGSFENIEIFFTYSDKDKEDVSVRFRKYYKDHISLWKNFNDLKTLPVAFNHWWPYEDKYINEDIFYDNASVAKQLGFTNATLDAGWFGPSEEIDATQNAPWYLKRGDWDMVNTKLFPSGLKNLGDKIKGLGLAFGIWCEIEAVGIEARFNQIHEDLLAKRDHQSLQYVCMGNPKSVAWALDILTVLIEEYGARWIKFDFNLDPGYGCDCEAHGHGKGDGLYHHYMGYYGLLDTLIQKYPDLIIENCSSGGLRMDYGLMKRSHVAHLSDPDYTKHHLQCYWGATSYIHPSACLHFSWSDTVCEHNLVFVPITKESTITQVDYMIRAVLMGVPGFSLKLVELPDWVLSRLQAHTTFYKEISKDYILDGEMHRLTAQTRSAKYEGEHWNGYQFSATPDRHIVFVFKLNEREEKRAIPLRNSDEEALYEVTWQDAKIQQLYSGYELMHQGISFESQKEVWSEVLFVTRMVRK